MKTYSRLATPELTRQLIASGALGRHVQDDATAQSAPGVLISQEGTGVHESCVFDLDCGYGTGYMVSLHVAVDLPVLEIWEWRLNLPWEDPQFQWLSEPPRSGSANNIYEFPDHQTYPGDAVLNHRRVVHRGRSLDGFLLGFGFESIPDCFSHRQFIPASIVLIDGMRHQFPASVQLWVNRAATIDRKRTNKNTRRRLFENQSRVEDELVPK